MRPWLAFGVAATVLAAPSSSARQTTKLSVPDAINLYARGDFDTAVRNLDTQTLRVAPFTGALDEWIASGPIEDRPRRHLVAAAFAIDANWTATRTFWNRRQNNVSPGNREPPLSPERERLSDFQSQPFVAQWAAQQLPVPGGPDALEQKLWLATIGLTEDGHAWERLQRDILPLARKRLPNEPRLHLAEVLARTNREVEPFRTAFPARSRDILRVESSRARASGPIANAIRAFEPLLADVSLAGEVELRLGYLELRRDRWPAALARFDAARSKATEPLLLATTDYFAGFAFEQLDRDDEAIAAYRRGVAITPDMRNLATRLSALLYLRKEREEAYSVLDRALNARPVPQDLMVTLERADGRFVPEWLAEIRKALK